MLALFQPYKTLVQIANETLVRVYKTKNGHSYEYLKPDSVYIKTGESGFASVGSAKNFARETLPGELVFVGEDVINGEQQMRSNRRSDAADALRNEARADYFEAVNTVLEADPETGAERVTAANYCSWRLQITERGLRGVLIKGERRIPVLFAEADGHENPFSVMLFIDDDGLPGDALLVPYDEPIHLETHKQPYIINWRMTSGILGQSERFTAEIFVNFSGQGRKNSVAVNLYIEHKPVNKEKDLIMVQASVNWAGTGATWVNALDYSNAIYQAGKLALRECNAVRQMEVTLAQIANQADEIKTLLDNVKNGFAVIYFNGYVITDVKPGEEGLVMVKADGADYDAKLADKVAVIMPLQPKRRTITDYTKVV